MVGVVARLLSIAIGNVTRSDSGLSIPTPIVDGLPSRCASRCNGIPNGRLIVEIVDKVCPTSHPVDNREREECVVVGVGVKSEGGRQKSSGVDKKIELGEMLEGDARTGIGTQRGL